MIVLSRSKKAAVGRTPWAHRRCARAPAGVHQPSPAVRDAVRPQAAGAGRPSAVAGHHRRMTALFVTRDRSLLDELLRLAAAAGVTPTSRPTARPPARLGRAPLVLVGADLADEVARTAARRRRVVTWSPGGGARRRCSGPRSPWARERRRAARVRGLAGRDAHRPRRRRQRSRAAGVGVVGGAAVRARRRSRARSASWPRGRAGPCVVDADPLGPGSTGCSASRPRRGALGRPLPTTGRLSARSLREALPRARARRADLDAGATGPPGVRRPRGAVARPARATTRSCVDLPARADPVVDEWSPACDRLLVVVVPTVAGVRVGGRVCAGFPTRRACGWSCAAAASTRERSPGHRRPRRRRDGRPARARRGDRPRAGPGAVPRGPLARAADEVLTGSPSDAARRERRAGSTTSRRSATGSPGSPAS
jgi:hypothetical protein